MCNVLEYSNNYSVTSGRLWNYYRDEVIDDMNENNEAGKSFVYKTKIVGSAPADGNALDREVIVPLKHASNFWRSLDLPLINCEIKLDLSWLEDLQFPKYQELLKYLLL